jgi:hypothetical protein
MKKLNVKFIKNELEKEGYFLLDDVYVDAHSYFDTVCPNGHAWKTSWSHWKKGRRCKYCNRKVWDCGNLEFEYGDKEERLNE